MKVAIIGIDSLYWPLVFTPTLNDDPDIDVIGYTDLGVDSEAVAANLGMTADEFGAEFDLPALADAETAYSDADAAVIMTRNSRMPGLITQALHADCHAFAAKPVGVDVAELNAIGEALDATTPRFGAGWSSFGYQPSRALRSVLADDPIGDLHTLRVMHNHGRIRDWGAGTWYTDPAEGNTCHYLGWYPVHFATAVFGPVTEIAGHAQVMPGWGADAAGDWETPTQCKAFGTHDNGRISTIEVYADIGDDWDVAPIEAEIVGTDGVVRYAASGGSVAIHQDGGVEEVQMDAVDDDANDHDLEAWLDACRGDGDPLLGGRDVLHVAAVGCAWDRSVREDRPVSVAITP